MIYGKGIPYSPDFLSSQFGCIVPPVCLILGGRPCLVYKKGLGDPKSQIHGQSRNSGVL